MKYEIIPCHYAPKRRDLTNENLSHSIFYGHCNFNCIFCNFRARPKLSHMHYDNKDFDTLLDELFKHSKNFKFTGGEPTLNPELIRHLTKIKDRGGIIYLDSNGSNPNVIEDLLKIGLVNVLGISLKGVTKEESVQVSRRNSTLSWDNVFKTLRTAGNYTKVHTIVTLVFTKANYKGRINIFADLIKDIPNVQLKVNNLLGNNHKPNTYELIRVQSEDLVDEVENFIAKNIEWKDRLILINTLGAVNDYSKIQFY